MKKAFLIISLIFIASVLTAQTQVGDSNSPIYHKNGNVGIGTTTPNATLEVKGRLAIYGSNENHTYGEIALGSNSTSPSWHIDDGDGRDRFRIFRQPELNKPGFETFTITNNGNVGIGTTTPNATLEVKGRLAIYGSNENHTYGEIALGSNSTSPSWHIDDSDGRDRFRIFRQPELNKPGFETFTITNNGNIGIGTVTPSHKLSVNGTIRAKEIIVDNNNWPDYVFESSYNLRELSEVQDFISKNGHLPDVPSAKMVHENGVSLAELNATLLQKVEELTLYIIDQQQQIDELKAAVAND